MTVVLSQDKIKQLCNL